MLYSYISPGNAQFSGKPAEAVDFTLKHQLLDTELWKKFVSVYREDSDVADGGWRNEYWGKMMRGACLTYMYTGRKALYDELLKSVEDMLTAQREDGRFSTYPAENQFFGWDMWGRKYILTGFIHFYNICNDETLKKRIITALKKHADKILEEVGNGKRDITQTSSFWGGVNSCSVLEPMAELYKLTGEKRYLDFCYYIISTGGCRDGDLIALADENRLMPFEYPETKAYETMSFFEGLLAMYEITGDKKYLNTVEKFAAAVKKSDITVIGCAGCTHELFDNSYLKQTLYSDGIMQETCVTVTWMRLNARLFMLTGKEKYFADIELSAYNALYGAINTNMLKSVSKDNDGIVFDALPFDSYSPLVNNKRGREVGGRKHFKDGSIYGCCACIASAGTALLPLTAVMQSQTGITVNTYISGTVTANTPKGGKLTLKSSSRFPAAVNTVMDIDTDTDEEFEISFRVPAFVSCFSLKVDGEKIKSDGHFPYVTVKRAWKNVRVEITGEMKIKKTELNGKVSLSYGVLVLARDEQKEITGDISAPAALKNTNGNMLIPQQNECVRIFFEQIGGGTLMLTDYASCGKDWTRKNCNISVWMNI